ncbi:MAG: hypothetical protein AAF098_10825 [Pseudomonadota bacterium]
MPVRLEITVYTFEEGVDFEWLAIPPDLNVQGCAVAKGQSIKGAFAVFADGKPRLVPALELSR